MSQLDEEQVMNIFCFVLLFKISDECEVEDCQTLTVLPFSRFGFHPNNAKNRLCIHRISDCIPIL